MDLCSLFFADQLKKTAVDSLFVLNQNGTLTEYHLEPKPKLHTGSDKPSDDAHVELDVKGLVQWNLQRSEIVMKVSK